MIYRNWRSYQDALAAYNAALAQHQAAVQRWNQTLARFDKDSSQAESVNGCGCFAVVVAGIITVANNVADQHWGWLIVWFLIFGFYQTLDEKVRAFQKRRFAASTPGPQFHAEEPTYEPPSEHSGPPPHAKAPPRREPPPPRNTLTLDTALSTLGLSRTATLEDLKRAYRDRIRDYHPDRVAHLGAELKELAERKAKEINAAYEYLRTALQSRNSP